MSKKQKGYELLTNSELKEIQKMVKKKRKTAWNALADKFGEMQVRYVSDIVKEEVLLTKVETILSMRGEVYFK